MYSPEVYGKNSSVKYTVSAKEYCEESQLENANLYNIAKAFAESVNKGDVKVKYEEESSTSEQKVPF